ncbi:glycosyltransferase [Bacillus sp. CIS52]
MDAHSFLFVICVNDESLYSRCKNHILKLTVPLSHSVDIMPIYDSESMASSYNKAL